jgi:hypothetical protein
MLNTANCHAFVVLFLTWIVVQEFLLNEFKDMNEYFNWLYVGMVMHVIGEGFGMTI